MESLGKNVPPADWDNNSYWLLLTELQSFSSVFEALGLDLIVGVMAKI